MELSKILVLFSAVVSAAFGSDRNAEGIDRGTLSSGRSPASTPASVVAERSDGEGMGRDEDIGLEGSGPNPRSSPSSRIDFRDAVAFIATHYSPNRRDTFARPALGIPAIEMARIFLLQSATDFRLGFFFQGTHTNLQDRLAALIPLLAVHHLLSQASYQLDRVPQHLLGSHSLYYAQGGEPQIAYGIAESWNPESGGYDVMVDLNEQIIFGYQNDVSPIGVSSFQIDDILGALAGSLCI